MENLNRWWVTEVVTEPPTTPLAVTADDVKKHLNIPASVTQWDSKLEEFIAGAQIYIEERVYLVLRPYTAKIMIDNFPVTGEPFWMPYYPIQNVKEITYTDTSGTKQTLAASAYQFDQTLPPRIASTDAGGAWPVGTRPEIEADFGYPGGSALLNPPADILQAIHMLVSTYFENRSHAEPMKLEKVPDGLESILNRYHPGNSYMFEAM